MNLTDHRDAAVTAAERAGRLIRRYAGCVAESAMREKGTHDLVTDIDEQAQRTIVATLTERFPDYDVLAEEGVSDEPALSCEGFRWIIDPIDGTTNFFHGVPPYAVSIALQKDEELLLGVVLDVARDELFSAVRGEGLYVNGRKVRVSRTSVLDDALISTGFPYRSFQRVDAYLASMRNLMKSTRGVRRPGSASIDLAYVGCGRFDAFFETDLSPWDVAAGIVLVEEGGGRITSFRQGSSPLSGAEVLASNGLLHEAMLDQLSPLRNEPLAS